MKLLESTKKAPWGRAAASLTPEEYERVVELHRGFDDLGDSNGTVNPNPTAL